jgi:uncharacterized protein (TIGR00369 family)
MIRNAEGPETRSARNGHSRCVLCGDLNPRSLKLSFQDAGDAGVKTRFTASHELQGYDGILHGGIVAGLLDAAMTNSLFREGVQAVTGDLHIRFIHPVSCGVPLEIRAWKVSSRPPFYRLKAEILRDGRVMARAEAKFLRRPRSA